MNTSNEFQQQYDLHYRFDQLQARLIPLWKQIGRTDPGGNILEEENTVVVLPSLTVDVDFPFPAQQAYEERMLFMLFLLRQPKKRLIYLTSMPIQAEIVDYYLHLLPSVDINHARNRLTLISAQDGSSRPLVEKFLSRPRLMAQVKAQIPDLDMAHLVPFLTTDLERDFAVQLDIPMYAADPRFFAFGTKSGCRQIFAEEGIQHPLGAEDLANQDELGAAIAQMRAQKPKISQVIIKHNDGVSGYGNARLNLTGLPKPGSAEENSAIAERLPAMQLEASDSDYAWYMAEFEKKGGIVEEMILGEEVASPSAQLRVSPLGAVELLSTHDQMLGGPSGHSYLGALFPAKLEYGPLIMRAAEKIGQRFAQEGIVGRFALDFIVVKTKDGNWEPYAIEVNLRKGGTTHPFLALQFMTDGIYNVDDGKFYTVLGHPKYYLAGDHVESDDYKSLTPQGIIDVASENRLHYDHTKQTGIILHMFSAVAANGNLGLTAIGNSPEHVKSLYDDFVTALDQAAK
jgi:hypothetical protein